MTSPPFPQRLKNKKEDRKHKKFISMLKELSLNILILKAIDQIPGYAKFMNDLITMKRSISYEDIGGLHYYSAITS